MSKHKGRLEYKAARRPPSLSEGAIYDINIDPITDSPRLQALNQPLVSAVDISLNNSADNDTVLDCESVDESVYGDRGSSASNCGEGKVAVLNVGLILTSPSLVVNSSESGTVSNKWSFSAIVDGRLEKCCEYLLLFLIHITLISIFETVFFFLFVSKDEDNGILSTTAHYTDALLGMCHGLNKNQTAALNYVFLQLFNASMIEAAGVAAATQRTTFNLGLMYQSWMYVGGLFGSIVVVGAFSKWRQYRIRWCAIIGENLVLVAMLGVYEFMFFETIIKKYMTESPDEISANFVKGLQSQCGLLV
jgi:hypothetical protein